MNVVPPLTVFPVVVKLRLSKVAIKVAPVSVAFVRDLRSICLELPDITIFWLVRGSTVPSEYTRVYLSIPYPTKAKLASPSLIVPEEFAIFTLYSFLTETKEESTSISETSSSGILANSPGSLETSIPGLAITKSFTVAEALGMSPSQKLNTSSTWDTVILFSAVSTETTLFSVGIAVEIPGKVYLIISFSLTLVNLLSVDVIVEIPVSLFLAVML